MDGKFELGPRGQEIADGLRAAIDHATLVLHDSHEKNTHVWLFREWRTSRSARLHVPQRHCHVEAAVNDRWTLAVWSWTEGPLHPSARSLVTWAAQKLAPYLPSRPADDFPYPPTGGGGGPSGSAEVGIPVWWVRRTRG
jgi:hypothetical protein